MYGIVIPNKYEDIIKPLLETIKDKIPTPPRIVIVADGHSRDYGFGAVPYDDEHFVFSRAVNIGLRYFADQDVVILNDDCRILEWNFFDRLAEFAYAKGRVGILSPLIVGCVGNPIQRWHERTSWWGPNTDFIEVMDPDPVCFPCVYLRRAMINTIGEMDETIAGYGYDDQDYSRRCRQLGWRTMVTQRLTVQHADGSPDLADGRGKSWATSFVRRWPGGVPPEAEIRKYLKRRFLK